jgi:uncharacterized membrane protein YphA (DoxX/SURF4 family)
MQFTTHASSQYANVATSAVPSTGRRFRRGSAALWTIQGVLAAVFLMAGTMKLVLPAGDLVGDTGLPVLFLRFVGVCEVAGALGLVLPGILGIRRMLTPLAAGGLVVIMVGATVVTLVGGDVAGAVVPATVGALACLIAVRRRTDETRS